MSNMSQFSANTQNFGESDVNFDEWQQDPSVKCPKCGLEYCECYEDYDADQDDLGHLLALGYIDVEEEIQPEPHYIDHATLTGMYDRDF